MSLTKLIAATFVSLASQQQFELILKTERESEMRHSLEEIFEASVQDGTLPGVVLLAKNSSGMTFYYFVGRHFRNPTHPPIESRL